MILETVAENLQTNFKGMRKLVVMPKSGKEPWGERYFYTSVLSYFPFAMERLSDAIHVVIRRAKCQSCLPLCPINLRCIGTII